MSQDTISARFKLITKSCKTNPTVQRIKWAVKILFKDKGENVS